MSLNLSKFKYKTYELDKIIQNIYFSGNIYLLNTMCNFYIYDLDKTKNELKEKKIVKKLLNLHSETYFETDKSIYEFYNLPDFIKNSLKNQNYTKEIILNTRILL